MEEYLSLGLSLAASKLVRLGIIRVDATFCRTGINVLAYVVQPHPKLGIMPHEPFSVPDLVKRLEPVTSTERKDFGYVTLHGGPPVEQQTKEKLVEPEGVPIGRSSPFDLKEIDHNRAHEVNRERGLGQIMVNGVKNQLAANCLSFRDLTRSPVELTSRAMCISDALGTEKVVQRIRMQPDTLRVQPCSTLSEWWDHAKPKQRFSVLSHSKRTGQPFRGLYKEDSDEFAPVYADKLRKMPCPFRDTDLAVYETVDSGSEWGL